MYNTDYNRRLREQLLGLNEKAIDHTKHFYMSIDDEFPHALGTGLQYAVADGVVGVGSGKEEESESESDEEQELEGAGDYGYGVGQYAKNFQGSYLDTAISTFDKPFLKPMATEQELIQMRDGGCKDCDEYVGEGMVRHDEVKAEMNEMGEEPLLTTKRGRGRKIGGFFGSDLGDAINFSKSPEGQALGQKLMDMFKGLKGRGFFDNQCLGINPDPSCRGNRDAYNNWLMKFQDKLPSVPADIKQMIMSGKGKKKVEAYLKGAGFWDDFATGFSIPFKLAGKVLGLGKKRGRPKKGGNIGLAQSEESVKHFEEKEGGKKRGRPKKGGKNIGLAQSPESVKFFEEKAKEGGKKKRGRPSKKGGAVLPDASSAFGANLKGAKLEGGNFWDTLGDIGSVALKIAPFALGLGKEEEKEGGKKKRGRPAKKEGGRMLVENQNLQGHYGGAKPKMDKKKRGALVSKLMKEKGMKLGEASKYVSQHPELLK